MAVSTDLHMHTSFSYDSSSDPERMIGESIDKGLQIICFTDHYDKDYFYNGCEAVFSIEKYFNDMLELKERYADKIKIKIGIELGLQPHLCEVYSSLAEYPFDMIIGSVHCLKGVDPYAGKLFKGKDDSEVYRLMFEETLLNISRYSDFDW